MAYFILALLMKIKPKIYSVLEIKPCLIYISLFRGMYKLVAQSQQKTKQKRRGRLTYEKNGKTHLHLPKPHTNLVGYSSRARTISWQVYVVVGAFFDVFHMLVYHVNYLYFLRLCYQSIYTSLKAYIHLSQFNCELFTYFYCHFSKKQSEQCKFRPLLIYFQRDFCTSNS